MATERAPCVRRIQPAVRFWLREGQDEFPDIKHSLKLGAKCHLLNITGPSEIQVYPSDIETLSSATDKSPVEIPQFAEV